MSAASVVSCVCYQRPSFDIPLTRSHGSCVAGVEEAVRLVQETRTDPHRPAQARTDPHRPAQTRTGPHRPAQARTGPHRPAARMQEARESFTFKGVAERLTLGVTRILGVYGAPRLARVSRCDGVTGDPGSYSCPRARRSECCNDAST
ncbi:hypothetical protein EYF80_067040 [Liparis tanakae]|uniref:Uncharacterized protein n=1 Tax=Liparis tanakae TaxID=230148 RepID=A0A4Z2E2G8_9TELE|nr:hypothetical protein EYF80_067040 [Liparis tanakae]